MAGRWTVCVPLLAIVAVLQTLSRFSVDGGSSMSKVFLAPPSSSATQAVASAPRQTWGSSPTMGGALSAPSALSVGAAIAVAAVLCAASRGGSVRKVTKTVRGASKGVRDTWHLAEQFGLQMPYPTRRAYYPGQRGFHGATVPVPVLPPPARQMLSKVEEALATYHPSDFFKVAPVELEPASVKEVSKPSDLPEYKKPSVGIRFEKEPGKKRSPRDDAEYEAYVAKRMNVEETMGDKGADKDIMLDRSVLLLLLSFLDEKLENRLKLKGSKVLPVDLVKISKKQGSKTLVMERIFEDKNLTAEFRPYRGAWKRSEASNHGEYLPAWHRAATGDIKTRTMMVTGLWQIKGGRSDMPAKQYKISEFDLGGISIAARSVVHAISEGKTVELRHKNWYFRQDLTMVQTYWQLLLGGADMLSIALQRSGKLISVLEVTAAKLLEGKPEIVGPTSVRLGRLAALLKNVKEQVEKAGDGPFVLQMRNGNLVLGKYEAPVHEEEEEEVTDDVVVERE